MLTRTLCFGCWLVLTLAAVVHVHFSTMQCCLLTLGPIRICVGPFWPVRICSELSPAGIQWFLSAECFPVSVFQWNGGDFRKWAILLHFLPSNGCRINPLGVAWQSSRNTRHITSDGTNASIGGREEANRKAASGIPLRHPIGKTEY